MKSADVAFSTTTMVHPWGSKCHSCVICHILRISFEMEQQHRNTNTQVASYPFDDSRFHKKTSWLSSDSGIYSASPDDAYFRLVSSLYASGHPHMSSGDNCDLQGSPKLETLGCPRLRLRICTGKNW